MCNLWKHREVLAHHDCGRFACAFANEPVRNFGRIVFIAFITWWTTFPPYLHSFVEVRPKLERARKKYQKCVWASSISDRKARPKDANWRAWINHSKSVEAWCILETHFALKLSMKLPLGLNWHLPPVIAHPFLQAWEKQQMSYQNGTTAGSQPPNGELRNHIRYNIWNKHEKINKTCNIDTKYQTSIRIHQHRYFLTTVLRLDLFIFVQYLERKDPENGRMQQLHSAKAQSCLVQISAPDWTYLTLSLSQQKTKTSDDKCQVLQSIRNSQRWWEARFGMGRYNWEKLRFALTC